MNEKVKGLINESAPVPGTDVTAFFGRWESSPNVWIYSLWTDDDTLVGHGELDFGLMFVTKEQVARVAFLLDVEYAEEV